MKRGAHLSFTPDAFAFSAAFTFTAASATRTPAFKIDAAARAIAAKWNRYVNFCLQQREDIVKFLTTKMLFEYEDLSFFKITRFDA